MNPSRPPVRYGWLAVFLAVGATWLAGADRRPIPAYTSDPGAGGRASVPFDVLGASPAELELLPGIGPALSRTVHRAIRTRNIGSLDELESIPGIGPIRAEQIRRSAMTGGRD